jgi:hypothetical protein
LRHNYYFFNAAKLLYSKSILNILPFQGVKMAQTPFQPKALPLGFDILRFQRDCSATPFTVIAVCLKKFL